MPIYERPDWIPLRVEEAVDPNRPIIDAHHHLWGRRSSTYLAPELVADTRGAHNVTHTVFVECAARYDRDAEPHMAPVGETRFVVEQATEAAELGTTIGAIVSHADLCLGDAVEEVLAAHDQAGAGLFRGIRHGTNWSDDPTIGIGHHDPRQHQMAEDGFRRGLATLGRMGFSFDAWIYFDQLRELADMARAVPETPIVLDHLGGPIGVGRYSGAGRLEMLEVWQAGITDVASCPNVVVKIGGIGMEHYYGTPWYDLPKPPSSDIVATWWSEIVHFTIDAFGPERCLMESNFPVDRQTLPYSVLWNALQILTDRYDESEKQAMFFDNSARVYRIDTGASA